jgi:very-short-patch-repair endonuclease
VESIIMNEFFNRQTEKDKRRQLRDSMPTAEVIFWSRLKGRQMLQCKFRRQFSVGAFVLDFYSPEIRLGIELDGDSHFQEGAREYDQERQAFIESFRIKIVRFLNSEIYENIDGVLESIGQEILGTRQPSTTVGEQMKELDDHDCPPPNHSSSEQRMQPPLTPPSQGGEKRRFGLGMGMPVSRAEQKKVGSSQTSEQLDKSITR